MARKSFTQLEADLATSFPDNITGLITPAVIRTYFTNLLYAIRPAYGLISRPTATAQAITATDAPLVFDTGYVSDVPDYTTTPSTGIIMRLEAGSTEFSFNASVDGPNGQLIYFTLYKNGIATNWRGSCTTAGAGKPVDVSIAGLAYEGTNNTEYQLRVKSTGATTITLSNMDFLAQTVPVNAY